VVTDQAVRDETQEGTWTTWDSAGRQHWIPPRWVALSRTACGIPLRWRKDAGFLERGEDQRRCDPCLRAEKMESNRHAGQAALNSVLAGLPGVTYRQLYNWVKLGHVFPDNPAPGSGYVMTFPQVELVVVRRIARLIKAGLFLTEAAQVARAGVDFPEGSGMTYLAALGEGIAVQVTA
jgi:hypothetical protein